MLINKGKASDIKLKQKNNIAVKEVPSKLKKNLNENLKKPLIKLLETNSFNRPNFSPLDKNFVNKIKPVVKSTPLTSVNNIRHGDSDNNFEKTSKLENTVKNSEFFTKRTSIKEEKAHLKKTNNKNENSNQNTFFTNNNTLLVGNQEKTVLSKQIITQGNVVSPIKMLRQISSLTNNNLTTNITELAKDGLTIKTNTIESGELANTMQSPSNYKTVGNNLKTISSKITPKATHNTFLASNLLSSKKNSNNNLKNINLFEKTIKIVEYNDEKNNVDLDNLNILQTIQQFGQILRNTNLGQNCIYSEENLRKINELNEVLKSLGNENKDSIPSNPSKQEDKTVSIGSGGRAVTISNNNLGGSLKAVKNNQKTYFSHTNNNGVKKNLKNLHNTVKQTLSPKMNTNERLLTKENEDCNITGFSEQKINSATKKDVIISEIYKNSDYRIKRYGVLFEFITTNIAEIKNLIMTSTLKKSEAGDEDKEDLMKLNLLSNHECHFKKKSSTSNEIDKIARKINEENNLMFSSISFLNSTPKKQPDSDKIASISKEKGKINYSENYNDSDIEEFDYNEDKKEYFQQKPNENSTNERVKKYKNKRKNNNTNILDLINVSKSFIISSINSEFYKDLFYESFFDHNNNNISNEMSELKGDLLVLNDNIEQSIILERKDINESLDKTKENINLLDRRKVVPQNVIKNIEKKFTIPVMKPKLASSHNIPKTEIGKGKINEIDNRTVVNNNLDNDPVINSDTKKEKDNKCIIY